MAYLCSEEGGYISGNVFSATAAGKVGLYSNPKVVGQIQSEGGALWEIDDLAAALKADLLGDDYESDAAHAGWGH